jgi:FixJ family two-component response regulator
MGDYVSVMRAILPSGSASRRESWVGIVDDDSSLRSALARALRLNGIRVETFASAEEFLDRASPEQPECIVLDIHLGGLSGFDLQDLLTARGTPTPIIFITAHEDMLSEAARTHGACGYLRKPFDTSALVALLRPHLPHSTSG